MTAARHVVLGSTGGAGNAIARALHDVGLDVCAVNRSGSADLPSGVEQVGADISDAADAGAALRGADVVYMAAQPPYHRWPQEFRRMLSGVIDATPDGARLVMVDNLYGYGPGSSPMSEQSPERATDAKGKVRRAMTRVLLEAHRSGRIQTTIGRASDYFGPRADNSAITALAIEPAAAGKTIRWTANQDVAHSVAYLPDIARAYVTLGTAEQAVGQVWILPHAPAVTGRELMAIVNAALPRPVATGTISTTVLRLASPFHRMSKEALGIAYQWAEPFVVDDSAFRSTFGPFDDTALDEAVRRTIEWYRSSAATLVRPAREA
ncbi:MAG: NAD-dependent epimerase/dehydratase family protein [Jiangellales bacterium]